MARNNKYDRMGACVAKTVNNAEAVFPRKAPDGHGDVIATGIRLYAKASAERAEKKKREASLVEGRPTPPELNTARVEATLSSQPDAAASRRQSCKIIIVPIAQGDGTTPLDSGALHPPVKESVSGDVSESLASSSINGSGSDSIIAARQISPTTSGTIIPLRVVERLGSGLDARVYSARRLVGVGSEHLEVHMRPSEEVAVKVVRMPNREVCQKDKKKKSGLDDSNEARSRDQDKKAQHTLARARDEARIVQSLDHPNIVKMYRVLQTENHLYQVEERGMCDMVAVTHICDGVPEHILKRWAYQIMSALAYAHAQGVVHGDIKPDNILLRASDGSVMIGDWGFARDSANEGQPHQGEFDGSENFAPPELLLNKRGKSPEADTWSTGATLYAMAYGRLPFGKVDTLEAVTRVCTQMPSFEGSKQTSILFQLLVSEMMAKNWQKRRSMAEHMSHAWLADESSVQKGIEAIKLAAM